MTWSLSFDGIDDTVSIPAIEPTDITAEIYFLPIRYGQGATDNYHFSTIAPGVNAFAMVTTFGGNWATLITTSGGIQFLAQVTPSLGLNVPHHVVLTYDQASGAARQYNEGVLSSSLDLTPGTAIAWGGGLLHISIPTAESKGKFAIARLWSRALSSDEVQNLFLQRFARTVTGLTTALELSLVMSDGSGTTLTDASGNGNNGTISGATWIAGDIGSKVVMTVFEHAGEVALGDPIQYTAAVIDGVNSAVISGTNGKRRRVRVFAEADCWIKTGLNPTATGGSDSIPLSISNPEYIDIEAGHVLTAITR